MRAATPLLLGLAVAAFAPIAHGEDEKRGNSQAMGAGSTTPNGDDENLDAPRTVERKYPRPTLLWAVTQLVPSPTWFISESGTRFALSWQVTPVLFSFATHKDISPWRFFAADPWARHGGSVELFVQPSLRLDEIRLASKFGTRFYVPMEGHGEKLSFATGTFLFAASEGEHIGFDAAFYVANGLLGLEASWVPKLEPYTFALSLRLRSM